MTALDQLIIEQHANHPPYGSVEDALYDPKSVVTVALTSDYGRGTRDLLVLARDTGEDVTVVDCFPDVLTYEDYDPDEKANRESAGRIIDEMARQMQRIKSSLPPDPDGKNAL